MILSELQEIPASFYPVPIVLTQKLYISELYSPAKVRTPESVSQGIVVWKVKPGDIITTNNLPGHLWAVNSDNLSAGEYE